MGTRSSLMLHVRLNTEEPSSGLPASAVALLSRHTLGSDMPVSIVQLPGVHPLPAHSCSALMLAAWTECMGSAEKQQLHITCCCIAPQLSALAQAGGLLTETGFVVIVWQKLQADRARMHAGTGGACLALGDSIFTVCRHPGSGNLLPQLLQVTPCHCASDVRHNDRVPVHNSRLR